MAKKTRDAKRKKFVLDLSPPGTTVYERTPVALNDPISLKQASATPATARATKSSKKSQAQAPKERVDTSPTPSNVASPNSHTVEGNFPRWWALFPFILPHSVRKENYEPALGELLEDYLLASSLWTGWLAKRWLTFCFAIRTAGLVFKSLWATLSWKIRRLIIGLLTGIVGAQYTDAIRAKLAQWFGLM